MTSSESTEGSETYRIGDKCEDEDCRAVDLWMGDVCISHIWPEMAEQLIADHAKARQVETWQDWQALVEAEQIRSGRLESLLRRAIVVAESERNAGAVARFITTELKALDDDV